MWTERSRHASLQGHARQSEKFIGWSCRVLSSGFNGFCCIGSRSEFNMGSEFEGFHCNVTAQNGKWELWEHKIQTRDEILFWIRGGGHAAAWVRPS